LAIDAGLDEATKLLDKLDLPKKDPFAAARALKSAGYRDQAKTEAVKQVTDNGAPTIPHDLLNSELKSGHPLLTDVKDEATIALEVLVGVIVAALVVNFLMVMGFGPVTMNRLGVGFAGSESRLKLWLGALWRSRLKVKDAGGDGGAAFSAAVRAKLRAIDIERSGSPSGSQSLLRTTARVSTPDDDVGLPDLGALDPRLKPVTAAVTALLRHDVLTLGSWLDTKDEPRPACTVEFAAPGRAPTSATLLDTAPTPAPAPGEQHQGATRRLSSRAAAWTAFMIQETRPAGDQGTFQQSVGTADWRSFAAFEAGLDAHLEGERAIATQCYGEALRRDGGNEKAKQNLGLLLLTEPDAEKRDGGLQLLLEIADGPRTF